MCGPADFRRVRPGDVLVCRETDPAWTPLFTVATALAADVLVRVDGNSGTVCPVSE